MLKFLGLSVFLYEMGTLSASTYLGSWKVKWDHSCKAHITVCGTQWVLSECKLLLSFLLLGCLEFTHIYTPWCARIFWAFNQQPLAWLVKWKKAKYKSTWTLKKLWLQKWWWLAWVLLTPQSNSWILGPDIITLSICPYQKSGWVNC